MERCSIVAASPKENLGTAILRARRPRPPRIPPTPRCRARLRIGVAAAIPETAPSIGPSSPRPPFLRCSWGSGGTRAGRRYAEGVHARRGCAAVLLLASASCARAHPVVSPGAPVVVEAQPRIVTPNEVIAEPELAARAAQALVDRRWRDAARDYGTLVLAEPAGPQAAEYLFDLGLALEGCQERSRARDAFLDLSRRFPGSARARVALVRAATLDAYLEDWHA